MSKINVQALLESANPYDKQLERSAGLVKKWEPTGLLKGRDLKGKYDKHNMAIILENQAKRLVVEQVQTNQGGASFATGQGEQWAGVALPLVRKIFADISSKEFMSVQPMTLPSGLVFYLEFKYGSNQPSLSGNSRFNSGDSLFGTTNQKNVDPFGGLYGAGKFGYSINEYTASVSYTIATASSADINHNSNYSSSRAAGFLRKLTISSASGSMTALDTLAVRSFVLTGSGVSETNLFPEFTTYASNDALAFIVSGTAGQLGLGSGSGTIYYSKQPVDNDRGDFEDRTSRSLSGSNAIPELDMDFRSEAIVAKTRKIMGKWTFESAQDINAYQNIDVESEITSTMSEYISMEVDLEMIDMVLQSVNTTDVWSATSNTFYNKSTGTFSQAAAGAGGYYNTQGQWFQTLGTKIQQMSRKIHKKTLRGQANVIYTSTDIASIIESIPGYAADTSGDKLEFALGTQKIGTLNSRWKVIVNPYLNENILMMAYKGNAFLETGAAYCPYVPLMMTPLVYDPNTFTPRKGTFTRYAKKMLRPEFFGAIHVANLDTV